MICFRFTPFIVRRKCLIRVIALEISGLRQQIQSGVGFNPDLDCISNFGRFANFVKGLSSVTRGGTINHIDV